MGFILGIFVGIFLTFISGTNIVHGDYIKKECEKTLIKDYRIKCLEIIDKDKCNQIFEETK